MMEFSQCCNPPSKKKLNKNKYKTEGVAQLQNIQRLGNNHVNFEKKKKKLFVFYAFIGLFYKRKNLKHFFFKNLFTGLYKNTKVIQIC